MADAAEGKPGPTSKATFRAACLASIREGSASFGRLPPSGLLTKAVSFAMTSDVKAGGDPKTLTLALSALRTCAGELSEQDAEQVSRALIAGALAPAQQQKPKAQKVRSACLAALPSLPPVVAAHFVQSQASLQRFYNITSSTYMAHSYDSKC